MKSRIGFISGILGLCALIGALVVISSRQSISQSPTGNTPFQIAVTLDSFGNGNFTVPSGKVLVIETEGFNGGYIYLDTTANSTSVNWLLGVPYGATTLSSRFYADASSTVSISGSASELVTLSGYLTNHI